MVTGIVQCYQACLQTSICQSFNVIQTLAHDNQVKTTFRNLVAQCEINSKYALEETHLTVDVDSVYFAVNCEM